MTEPEKDPRPCSLEDAVKQAQEVIERYLKLRTRNTAKSYRVVFTQWIEWCGEQDRKSWLPWADTFAKADQKTAMEYYQYLQGRKGLMSRDGRSDRLAPTTLRHRLGSLRKLYSWLIEQGVVAGKNPFLFPRPKLHGTPTKRPTQALTEEQTVLMLEAFPGNDYRSVMDTAILALLFGLALRRGEVTKIRIADLRAANKELVLAEQKNQLQDVLTVPDWVWETLTRYLARRGKADLHETLFVKRTTKGAIGESYVRGVFKRAADYVGLPKGYSCHSARATAITHLYDSGLTTREIQPFARHSTGAVTEKYDKRRQDQLRHVAATLQYKKAS